MEDLLYVKDYYLPVFTIEKPENKTDAEWTILHKQVGIKFEDEIQGLWLLGTLLDTWETFRTPLSNSAPDGVITMELAKGSILNEETRRKSQGSSSQSDTPGDFGVVRMGNTGLSRIASIGDICLKFDTGMELVLHNVKHVPDMRLNIISTGLLNEDGYHNSCGNGLWKVTPGSLIMARGKRESKLYMTHPKISKSIVNANVLSGVHDINLKRCSHCLAGKQTRLAFKSRYPFRMENILDLTKDQVLDVFKQFHALVERRTMKKLKCIRTDNGAEYIGPFDAYCREHGIQHQKTPPKTPRLNGLAERMNRNLVKRVRCLLSHAGVWSGKDVSYHHLRVFGCKAYVHIPKDERSKLDVKGKSCMFLGYGQDEFGYKLYDLNDEEHDEEQGADDVDAQVQPNLDEDVHPELLVPDMPPFLLLRRSTRDHHPSTRYSAHEYVLLTDGGEPECYAKTMEDEHKKEWFEAMEDEMNSLHENNTFELARLVVKGFSQKRGIDFDEIFSPVVKMGSIRVVLGLAASLDLEVEQMDVKTVFLHGDLDKEIYMEQPEGFQVKGKEGYKFGDDDFIILLLYVDDMLIVGKNIRRIAQLKRELSKSFSMKDLGLAKQIIGIRIFCDRGAKKLRISQEQYIEKVLCRFNMDKAKVVSSPLTTNFKLTDKDCPSSKKNALSAKEGANTFTRSTTLLENALKKKTYKSNS
ncbi:putative RNA-directed DNA polymerase [Tanacetum coccineum]